MKDVEDRGGDDRRGIAIIGMACRFPGANDWREFWANLCGGIDSIRHFSEAELRRAGIPEKTLKGAGYVKASPVIDGFDLFDAGFFEYSPREARLMDPQQRILLEEAWHALEDAGHDPGNYDGRIGGVHGLGRGRHQLSAGPQGVAGRDHGRHRAPGQRQGLRQHQAVLQVRPDRPVAQRADRLLDLDGGGSSGLPEHPRRRMRDGAGGGGLGAGAADQRLSLPPGRHPLAGRGLPGLRRGCPGHGVRQWRRGRGAQASRRRGRRRRPCPRRAQPRRSSAAAGALRRRTQGTGPARRH